MDLAANAPVQLSNTHALERGFDWHGVCIEPLSKLVAQLAASRSCVVVQALVSQQDGAELTFREKSGSIPTFSRGVSMQLHTVSKVITAGMQKERGAIDRHVHARSLASILRNISAPSTIDYLSLDYLSLEVLHEDFAWSEFSFLAMTIERVSERLAATLRRHGYSRVELVQYSTLRRDGAKEDELWINKGFPGGVDAASARARAATMAWRRATGGRINWRGIPAVHDLALARSPASPTRAADALDARCWNSSARGVGHWYPWEEEC